MENYFNHLNEDRRLENEREQEENYLNLWSYLRQRYPDQVDLETRQFRFTELISLKNSLEGPNRLRHWGAEIATVLKH